MINVLIQVPILSSLQKVTEPSYYGRVMSLFTMLTSITAPISLMIEGAVIGISMTYLISIGFLLLAMIATIKSYKLKR